MDKSFDIMNYKICNCIILNGSVTDPNGEIIEFIKISTTSVKKILI